MQKLNLRVLLCALALSGAAFGQDKTYPIGSSTSVLNNVRQQLGAARQQSGVSRLGLKVSPSLTLPAAINYRLSSGANQEQIAGTIERVPNSSFYLFVENNTVRGHIMLGTGQKAYKYTSDAQGNAFIEETDINDLVCINYNTAPPEAQPTSAASGATSGSGSIAANAVTDLQSYPGGNGCVLLDFDGQLVQGTPWNNGNPINAAPANLSDAEKQAVWEIVAEDYRPFHLNVTTSEAVFNTYPRNRRMRCIFTPTNTAAPGAGGVAYLGSFNWNDETPCWVFNGGIKGAGEAGSHEVGHTFGLGHDGRTSPSEGYYRGHGDWAPIMGVGYYEPIVQWSKGEYNSANNKEDDLAKISSTTYGVGYRADDHGNTTAAASALTVAANGAVNSAGLIERTGELDYFRFTTGGGNLNLTFTSSAVYKNLDIVATLYNSSGGVITTANPAGLNATITSTLAAGTYYVSVTGGGVGDPLSTGYSNYASLGLYTITGTVAGGTNNAIVTFFQDCNYGGTSVALNAGNYTTAQLGSNGLPDNYISSIRIAAGYEVVLYKNDNFTGGTITVTGDQACLVAQTWNDSTSSLRIRPISNTLPTVAISSPTNGSAHAAPASIAINVNATDADGSIAKVEFYNGNTKLGEDAAAPYSYVWGSIVAGTYTIRAVATDDRGGQSTAQVNVTVSSGNGATVYKHCGYGGYAISLPIGTYTMNQLAQRGVLNDDVSSLQVNSGYEIVLYRDENFTGQAYVFRSNWECLVTVGLSNGTTVNLNDWATSIIVRQSTARTKSENAEELNGLEVLPPPSLIVSPNPASNRVIIQYGDAGAQFDVNIIDVNGAVVYRKSGLKSGQPVNIEKLQRGIYFVRINTGKEIMTKKIIKQ